MKKEAPKPSRMNDQWCENDEDTDDIIYVNLHENRESYTAYNGSKIWQALYEENCMLDRAHKLGLNPQDICSEETLLYHVISGIHTSVNMHISTFYYDME